jgi:hypothetical protein
VKVVRVIRYPIGNVWKEAAGIASWYNVGSVYADNLGEITLRCKTDGSERTVYLAEGEGLLALREDR